MKLSVLVLTKYVAIRHFEIIMSLDSFQEFLSSHGAEYGELNGKKLVKSYGDIISEYRSLTKSVALIDLTSRGCLAVLGADRVKYINGQITNEVMGLQSGQGCYAALVNAKAKMQSDLNIYRLEDELILDFEPGLIEIVKARLESHIVSDNVELVDVSPHFGLLSLQGPDTGKALASLGLSIPTEPLSHVKVSQPDAGEWFLMHNSRFGHLGCDLYIPRAYLTKATERLFEVVVKQGGGLSGWEATEISRIESGIPRFGSEMDQNTLPPEVNIEARAISYSKGCYIGQEIIARIRTYGRVNRTLVGFRFDQKLAEKVVPGTLLQDEEGKSVAKITSIAKSPKFGIVALGLARRTHADLGNVLNAKDLLDGRATITSLPFC